MAHENAQSQGPDGNRGAARLRLLLATGASIAPLASAVVAFSSYGGKATTAHGGGYQKAYDVAGRTAAAIKQGKDTAYFPDGTPCTSTACSPTRASTSTGARGLVLPRAREGLHHLERADQGRPASPTSPYVVHLLRGHQDLAGRSAGVVHAGRAPHQGRPDRLTTFGCDSTVVLSAVRQQCCHISGVDTRRRTHLGGQPVEHAHLLPGPSTRR